MDLTDKTLGPYKIEKKLGEGGMGAVYKATHRYLGRIVAIKILPPELARDPDFTARFQSEGQAVAALEHPNIVPIYEAGEIDGYSFLAMRFINGYSLSELASRGPISLQHLLPLMEQATAALDAVHAHGIVHRDIKPGNLLLEGSHLFLADFGIAKRDSGDFKTRTGMVVGTPEYMAPEQLMGKALDGRADIYALGVLCYQLLAGQVPFAADNPAMVIYRKMSEPCPDLRQARPDLPEGVAMVLARAMASKPEDRFASAGEFSRALAAAAKGASMPDVISAARPGAHDATVVDMSAQQPVSAQQPYPSPPYGQPAYGTPPQGQFAQGGPYGTQPAGQQYGAAPAGQPYGTPPPGQHAQVRQPYPQEPAPTSPLPARRSKLPMLAGVFAVLLLLAAGGFFATKRLRTRDRVTPQATQGSEISVIVPTLGDVEVQPSADPLVSPTPEPTPEPTAVRPPHTVAEGWKPVEFPRFGIRLAVPAAWEDQSQAGARQLTFVDTASVNTIRTTVVIDSDLVAASTTLDRYVEAYVSKLAETVQGFGRLGEETVTVRGVDVFKYTYEMMVPDGKGNEFPAEAIQYFVRLDARRGARIFKLACIYDPEVVEAEAATCDEVLNSVEFVGEAE